MAAEDDARARALRRARARRGTKSVDRPRLTPDQFWARLLARRRQRNADT